jgi:hypothetical protein
MVDIVIGCGILLAALTILGYGFAFFFADRDKEGNKLATSVCTFVGLSIFSLFFLKTCDNGSLVSWPDKYEGITRPLKYADQHGNNGVDLSREPAPATRPLEK